MGTLELDRRRTAWRLPLAAAALALAAAGTVAAATAQVAAVNFRFEPAALTISVGDTVDWRFSGEPHTITSGVPGAPDGRFDSGIVQAGGSYARQFNQAGTFAYYCAIHPEDMAGTIVVRAATTAPPTVRPTRTATPVPTPRPTPRATPPPTQAPRPTPAPTPAPTATPTAKPSPSLTFAPTGSPTPIATARPSPSPTAIPPAPVASPALSPGAPAPSTGDGDAAAGESGGVPVAVALLGVVLGVGALAALRSRTSR